MLHRQVTFAPLSGRCGARMPKDSSAAHKVRPYEITGDTLGQLRRRAAARLSILRPAS